MKRLIPIIVLLGMLLSSCATKRQAEPRRYDSMSQKAHMTLRLDQREYTVNSGVQVWRNELIIISLQPVLGIEMFRIEATQDSLLAIDKMNRRYTSIAYNWSGKEISPQPTYKLLQDIVTSPLTRTKKTSNERTFMVAGHEVGIQCKFSQREYNHLPTPRRTNLKKYKHVSLRDIIPL